MRAHRKTVPDTEGFDVNVLAFQFAFLDLLVLFKKVGDETRCEMPAIPRS